MINEEKITLCWKWTTECIYNSTFCCIVSQIIHLSWDFMQDDTLYNNLKRFFFSVPTGLKCIVFSIKTVEKKTLEKIPINFSEPRSMCVSMLYHATVSPNQRIFSLQWYMPRKSSQSSHIRSLHWRFGAIFTWKTT